MDIVYPVKLTNSEELRYSLRSLKNIPHGGVFIAGEAPEWAGNVIHIPRDQSMSKHQNSTENVLDACKDSRVSENFILMNDDFFIMRGIDRVKPLRRGSVKDVMAYYRTLGSGPYLEGMQRTQEVLRVLGFKNPYSYELHVPMVINKQKFIEVIRKQREIDSEINAVHKRTLYGNYAGVGGRVVPDVKVARPEDTIPRTTFISTSNHAFREGRVGEVIRSTFSELCRYEKNGTIGV